ncbi:hypothetical protein AMS68_003300 [Peltaster fructicola]|uniref:Uncharacterized protein n=1 Tax=Peltaster fructicola TaxID=286661 RepID=A0A6H0XST8_9PEZI|nr:hypothetical protein AMS68_003300 [Peltaster fructicola]
MLHLQTNTIGPIITAQKLLATGIKIGLIVFISSDSGSASRFNDFEDGFAAYAASKAALNQALRHMAAELKKRSSSTAVIALHPGEVRTDMADIMVDWEVQGQMTVSESVQQCLKTIMDRTTEDNGTFWTWQNEQYPW